MKYGCHIASCFFLSSYHGETGFSMMKSPLSLLLLKNLWIIPTNKKQKGQSLLFFVLL